MITVLGSTGFIGSNLVLKLKEKGIKYYAPSREENIFGKQLGHVIYCIGLTADSRFRPFDTIEAHVSILKNILQNCFFDSLVYLSSTRVYIHSNSTKETDLIPIQVNDSSDIFNSSKLLGESIALHSGRKNIKVVRLSNFYGNNYNANTFLDSIMRDAVMKGEVLLHTTPDSAKDYIGIGYVTDMLIKISLEGEKNIYNIASGQNTSNQEIMLALQQRTSCRYKYSEIVKKIVYPPIDISRITSEFGKNVSSLLEDIHDLIENCKLYHFKNTL